MHDSPANKYYFPVFKVGKVNSALNNSQDENSK